MKQFFKFFGIVIIFLMTFFYNEKAVQVIKNYDTLMNEIDQIKDSYKIEPVEAEVTKDSIIPGINGRTLNTEETYYEMKKIGYINENYLQFDIIKIKDSLENNIDKLIVSGNKNKKSVALIIVLDNNDMKYNIKNLSYFGSGEWYEKKEGELDGITGFENNFTNISWLSYSIKTEEQKYFCLYRNEKTAKNCSDNKLYTIKEQIIDNNFLIEVKKKLNNGKIFIFKKNDNLDKEIELVYKYIINKGYDIEVINNLLKE